MEDAGLSALPTGKEVIVTYGLVEGKHVKSIYKNRHQRDILALDSSGNLSVCDNLRSNLRKDGSKVKFINSWPHLYHSDWSRFEIKLRVSMLTLFQFKVDHGKVILGLLNFRVEIQF